MWIQARQTTVSGELYLSSPAAVYSTNGWHCPRKHHLFGISEQSSFFPKAIRDLNTVSDAHISTAEGAENCY